MKEALTTTDHNTSCSRDSDDSLSSDKKTLSLSKVKKFKEKTDRTGLIYLSRIPPHMKPEKIRHLLSKYGEIGKIYLVPEDDKIRKLRKKMGGNKKKNFTEGWVEFMNKKVAKNVAECLNNNMIGGKKSGFYHDDIWNIKYLPKFKWHHLIEHIAHEKATREQRLRVEIAQGKRENKVFLDNVEAAKKIQGIEERKRKRLASDSNDQCENKVEATIEDSLSAIKARFKQRKIIHDEKGLGTTGGKSQKSSLLGKAPATALKKKLLGYVGFANLPKQVYRKSIKQGFSLTVMVAGESGLGKTTLINTLFNTSLYPSRQALSPSIETPKTLTLQTIAAEFEEDGVRLKVTLIDTPGFGDFLNNEESWRPIVDDIEARLDSYLDQESRVHRANVIDNRIHACLYFIAPTGHCLRPLDIEFMKKVDSRVNLIPIIAKSDTLTAEEIMNFKQRILEDIIYHKIQIFKPAIVEEDSPSAKETIELARRIPFAVVGSESSVLVNGSPVRGREYPWGIVEVDNPEHNDFFWLRQLLIRKHLVELKGYTNDILYENYRVLKLANKGDDYVAPSDMNPVTRLEEERIAHEQKLQRMEEEMRTVFQQKVQEKEKKLQSIEEELLAKHRQVKEGLERRRAELAEKKAALEERSSTPDKGRRKLFK